MNRIFFISLFLFSSFIASAQSFMHSYGAAITAVHKPKILENGFTKQDAIDILQTSLCYFPRFNFIESDNSSVSVGAPVSIGIGIASSVYGEDAGLSFAYDLPIVLDYNIGCKSTTDNENNFGGYLGLGFGYNHFAISGSRYSNVKGNSYGPILRAGIRFKLPQESSNDHGVSVGFFYKPGLETEKWRSYGAHVLLDL